MRLSLTRTSPWIHPRHLDDRGNLAAVAGGALLVGICLLALAFYRPTPRATPVQQNELLLGDAALSAEVLEIDPALPGDISGTSVASLAQTRSHMASMLPQIAAKYVPTPELFTAINPSRPWFGTVGYYFYGIGANTETGPAVASRILFNPALLIEPEFSGLSIWDSGSLHWDFAKVGVERASRHDFPLYPQLHKIEWNAKERIAVAQYRLSKFLEDVAPHLSKPLKASDAVFMLNTLNARDWGLKYSSVSSTDSSNVSGPFNQIVANDQRFELNDLCGPALGCNHLSSPAAALTGFRVNKLPAKLAVKLWNSAPAADLKGQDFTFVIQLD